MTLGFGGWLSAGGRASLCDMKNRRKGGHGVQFGTQVRGGAYRCLSEHGEPRVVHPPVDAGVALAQGTDLAPGKDSGLRFCPH